VPNIYTEIPLPHQNIIQILIGTFGGETAYLVEEYDFHHDIDGKRHVCFNDVFSLGRQSDGI
jgi:hypothetical protein